MTPPLRLWALWFVGAGAFTLTTGAPRAEEWQWRLPKGFPAPRVPPESPMTAAKVLLGRHLFYDERLSGDLTMSCASCHQPARAFSDGRTTAIGSTGEVHRRNAMAIVNVAYASHLTWANPLVTRLEDQALVPMFGDEPIELGLPNAETLLERLKADGAAVARFRAAFPDDDDPVTLEHVVQAIATFERTLISGDSPYDRFIAGDTAALSASAQRGLELFLSERLECFHCHGGFNFTDSFGHAAMPEPERAFHNTALYNVDGRGAYPSRDQGLMEHTGKARDMGRFRAPTLRNIALTGPYMHDGSIPTLEDVVRHYELGGRALDHGPDAGDGAASPLKDPFLQGFVLTDAERVDLLAFLDSLTDAAFVTNPAFSDPESPGAVP